jgi:hypothetical protein
MKYCGEIFFLQDLHLPFNDKKEIRGMLSNHLIFFLHFGQRDRPVNTCLFFGKR